MTVYDDLLEMLKPENYDSRTSCRIMQAASLAITELQRELQKHKNSTDFICRKFGEWFEPPCSYIFDKKDVYDLMFEKYPGWCDENCHRPYGKCWKMFFEALEADDGTSDTPC